MEPARNEEPRNLQEMEFALEIQGRVQLTATDEVHGEHMRKEIRRISRSRGWKIRTLRSDRLVVAVRRDFEPQTDIERAELADAIRRLSFE